MNRFIINLRSVSGLHFETTLDCGGAGRLSQFSAPHFRVPDTFQGKSTKDTESGAPGEPAMKFETEWEESEFGDVDGDFDLSELPTCLYERDDERRPPGRAVSNTMSSS